ncbi:MAG: HAD-IIIC family phosphatase [Alphaproteobacteria bacterium]|nr:HAD-IIIC family phosphatase [Alphaproteobacteria bacterium]
MTDAPLTAARKLAKAGEHAQAAELLVDAVRRDTLTPLDLEAAGRRFLKLAGDLPDVRPLRVRLLGQCTTQWLAATTTAIAWGRRQPASVTDGEFDNVLQELAALSAGEVDVVVLLPWSRQLLASKGSVDDTVGFALGYWQACWAEVARIGCKLVMVGYDTPQDGAFGVSLGGAGGAMATVRALDAAVRGALPQGAYFVDLQRVAGDHGRRTFYDARRWFWTRQPFSETGVVALARHLQAGLRAVTTGPKKVLVLDLDNTLWGGVVGELGPLGVALGESPDGEAFRAFQAACKALGDRGVVLAVASKNNDADAREPFTANPDMVLRLDDLAAFEAHWEPKGVSLARIASTLRLGLDSFVFFDDNPAEREHVRQAHPTVEVVDVPDDPAGYVDALERGLWFEAAALTDADAARARQYQQERQRQELAAAYDSVDGWLRSMEMVGSVRRLDATDVQRAVQLLGKTNQFNLTTRRHSRAVVEGWMADPRALPLTFRLADRFGDHGLVGLVIGVPEDEHTLRLDTLLMSCRVIGRTAEQFLFGQVMQAARALGYTRLVAEYIPSAKNGQVAELYVGFGLEPHPTPAEAEEGLQRFLADLEQLALPDTHVQADGDRA